MLSAAVGAANERIDQGYEVDLICKLELLSFEICIFVLPIVSNNKSLDCWVHYIFSINIEIKFLRDFDFINVMSYDFHGR